MSDLKVGVFYKLPHGVGKFIGRENNIGTVNQFTRYKFHIDKNCKWAKLNGNNTYFCYRKNIGEEV